MAAIVETATLKGTRANVTTAPRTAAPLERITVADDPEAIFERFASEGWADGLPIVAPTEERVERMLAGSDFDSYCSLGPLPPSWGEATIAKLAVNAVMAGCTP